MKNIHVIPTTPNDETAKGVWIKETRDWCNIYITSDEEIKEGDWVFDLDIKRIVKADNLKVLTSKAIGCWYYKKIILTTDQDLIKDGVQALDDKFLEWFVKNPSCEEVEIKHFGTCCGNLLIAQCINCNQYNPVYKIIIPKEEPKYTTSNLDNDKYKDYSVAKERAKNYMSLKGALEPKDVVLGYKTSLDAQMLDKISKQETSKITRIEVIQHSPPYNGRAYTNYNAKDVEIQFQDDGKTLKIFLK
jgi:hypothetical protein